MPRARRRDGRRPGRLRRNSLLAAMRAERDYADLIAVRDSKNPDGARLAFGREAWEAFAASLKADTN